MKYQRPKFYPRPSYMAPEVPYTTIKRNRTGGAIHPPKPTPWYWKLAISAAIAAVLAIIIVIRLRAQIPN